MLLADDWACSAAHAHQRKRQTLSRALQDGRSGIIPRCHACMRALVAINVIGMLTHQLPILFLHAYTVLALRRDDEFARRFPEPPAEEELLVAADSSWAGGLNATDGSWLGVAATATAVAASAPPQAVWQDDGWNWGLDTSAALLWLSMGLAATGAALGLVLLEAHVAVFKIREQTRRAPSSPINRMPVPLRRALYRLEWSVFLHRLPVRSFAQEPVDST